MQLVLLVIAHSQRFSCGRHISWRKFSHIEAMAIILKMSNFKRTWREAVTFVVWTYAISIWWFCNFGQRHSKRDTKDAWSDFLEMNVLFSLRGSSLKALIWNWFHPAYFKKWHAICKKYPFPLPRTRGSNYTVQWALNYQS